MSKTINEMFGFDREKVIRSNKCVPAPIGCGKDITLPFKDIVSEREYQISGLCQECQDKFFGA